MAPVRMAENKISRVKDIQTQLRWICQPALNCCCMLIHTCMIFRSESLMLTVHSQQTIKGPAAHEQVRPKANSPAHLRAHNLRAWVKASLYGISL